MRFINCLFLISIILLSSACTQHNTHIRHIKEYEKFIRQDSRILILPPTIEVNTVDISNRKTRSYNYEYHLENTINKALVTALQGKGFKVRILERTDIREQKLSDNVIDLRQNYTLIRQELYSKPLWNEDEAFSVKKNAGMPAILLGEKMTSNLILIAEYAGSIKTNGARIRDFAGSIIPGNLHVLNNADRAIMAIGIINAENGDILWANIHSSSKDLFTCAFDSFSPPEKVETENINELVANILNPLFTKEKDYNGKPY